MSWGSVLLKSIFFAEYAARYFGGVVFWWFRHFAGNNVVIFIAAKSGFYHLAADFRIGEPHGAGGQVFVNISIVVGKIVDQFRRLNKVLGNLLLVVFDLVL